MYPIRQTVFYTPTTITISEGQKIRGRLSCAPNTQNNRDLDIMISYETEGAEVNVEYKMCVVFPFCCAALPRLVNSADRWSGVNCILCLACLATLRWLVKNSMLFGDFWWFGGGCLYRY